MRRKTFLILSILWVVFCISASVMFGSSLAMPHLQEGYGYNFHTIGALVGGFLGLLVFLLFLSFMICLMASTEGHHIFIGGISTISYKKMYHSDLGTFYTNLTSSGDYTRISIYKQTYLSVKELFTVYHNGDMNITKKEIKDKLDSIYTSQLEKIRRENSAKSWDGYLDKQSRRDEILNKLIK